MYPLTEWSAEEIAGRIKSLRDKGFEIEAVFASTQLIEQLLKRMLAFLMVRNRVGFLNENGLSRLVEIPDCKSRDNSIRMLEGIARISDAWRLFTRELKGINSLPYVMDSIGGNGSWQSLTSKKKYIKKIGGEKMEFKYGLFTLRNKLTHGLHCEAKKDIELHLVCADDLILKLLDKNNGLYKVLNWDPLTRLPAFRKGKIKRSEKG